MPKNHAEASPNADHNQARKRWMGVLARTGLDTLEEGYAALSPAPKHAILRKPETGLVMVQGRANGTGQKFNAGEMTVTRCSVRMPSGTIGHAYVAGRSRRHAELAAIFDALLQDPDHAPEIEEHLITPSERSLAEMRQMKQRKAAATKVDFFTMVRGEDPK